MATKISKAFTSTKGISGEEFLYVPPANISCHIRPEVCSIDYLVPTWASLPATLAESHYENPMDNLHIGLQVGLRTSLHAFEWFAKHPKVFNDFNFFMSAQREGRAYWLDFYPFEQKLSAEARDKKHDVLFVDVGGALGSDIKELGKRYPSIKGRMILQDQQQTIDHVSVDPGMEAMVHDFFTPQLVIGTSSRNVPLNQSEQPPLPT